MKRRWKTRPRESRTRATRRQRPALRFSPGAWARFLFLRDAGETEVGGFGISDPQDPLAITDVALIPQRATSVSVAFDDAAVADYFDQQIDAGRRPEQFARVWLHTHPGDSALPSSKDEETFARVFGGCDWAVMGILSRGGTTYARLRFSAGPGGELRIPFEVDFSLPFPASDPETWGAEYHRCVQPAIEFPSWFDETIVDFGEAGWGFPNEGLVHRGTASLWEG